MEAVHQEVFYKVGVFRNFAKFKRKHLCRVSFLISCSPHACNFVEKETLVQLFCCEFCKITKSNFRGCSRVSRASLKDA